MASQRCGANRRAGRLRHECERPNACHQNPRLPRRIALVRWCSISLVASSPGNPRFPAQNRPNAGGLSNSYSVKRAAEVTNFVCAGKFLAFGGRADMLGGKETGREGRGTSGARTMGRCRQLKAQETPNRRRRSKRSDAARADLPVVITKARHQPLGRLRGVNRQASLMATADVWRTQDRLGQYAIGVVVGFVLKAPGDRHRAVENEVFDLPAFDRLGACH